MAGLFQGLELGKRALLTHQLNLQTIGHNIANVDTPGFRRQRVSFQSSLPEQSMKGPVGTGIQAVGVRHIRDVFLTNQYRKDNRELGQWTYKEKTLSQIEAAFGEPNDTALSSLITDFFDSWESLARGDQGAQAAIVEQASLLTNGFHELANNLINLQDSVDSDLVMMTSDINSLTAQIANLNDQIKRSELDGDSANDLRDIRDHALDQLSTLIDVNTHESAKGDMIVYIGSMAIVDQNSSHELDTRVINMDGRVRHELIWKGTEVTIKNLNGQLKGLIESRDETVPQYLDQLDTLASALVQEINAIHRTGYGADGSTGLNFFDPARLGAVDIRLNSEIIGDSSKIAFSQSGEEGDTRIARALADLRTSEVLNNNTSSLHQFYSELVAGLGVKVNQAKSFAENYSVLVNQIENEKFAVEGVSLDEEMANMVKFQHAYDAAARVITTMDQALDTVINGMGVVGR